MLIGLASKSAILIVEFANQQLRGGASRSSKPRCGGAQTRLRPILMTSIAFVIARGAARLRHAAPAARRGTRSGTVVFGGMLLSTFLNLAITPVLYVIIKSITMRGRNRRSRPRIKKTAKKDQGFNLLKPIFGASRCLIFLIAPEPLPLGEEHAQEPHSNAAIGRPSPSALRAFRP